VLLVNELVSKLRYRYTPRRGTPSRNRGLHPVILPVILGVLAVAGFWVLRSGGGGGGGIAAPDVQSPPRTLAVLGASCESWQHCGATPSPTRREEEENPVAVPAPAPTATPTPVGEADPPAITGVATVVMEEQCGEVVYSRNADVRRAPASITKIMTALVAEENSDLDELIPVTVSGSEYSLETDSTVMGIEPGQTLSMRDLLYGLLLPSGNDAALQIADHVAGGMPEFVRLMNEKAAELGLQNTHFANPHGLDDPELYASAYDMAILGRELLRRPVLAEAVKTPAYQPAWEGPAVGNLNQFLGFYPGALGIKTGYTPLAGQTIVAAAEQGGRRLIVTVLGSHWDIYKDASELLNWAFQSTEPACGADGLSLAHP
jgi:D-alanyl-D-alanine carboxypeptidase